MSAWSIKPASREAGIEGSIVILLMAIAIFKLVPARVWGELAGTKRFMLESPVA